MVKQLSVDPDRPAQTEIASSSATDSAARGATPAGLAAPAPEGRAPVHNPAHNPARPTTQLPSSNADYLNNPPPIYPAISQRLGEQGKVLLRVLIGKNGSALRGDIEQSSGFERLDQAALRAARQWRDVPGQRDGIAEDMWYTVPIVFGIRAE